MREKLRSDQFIRADTASRRVIIQALSSVSSGSRAVENRVRERNLEAASHYPDEALVRR